MVSLSAARERSRHIGQAVARFLRIKPTFIALVRRWRLEARWPGWPPLATHFCAFLAGVLLVSHQRSGAPSWLTQARHFRLLIPLSPAQVPHPIPLLGKGEAQAVRVSQQRPFCRLWREGATWLAGEKGGQYILAFRQWPEPWMGVGALLGKKWGEAWEWRPAETVEALSLCRDVERVSYGGGDEGY